MKKQKIFKTLSIIGVAAVAGIAVAYFFLSRAHDTLMPNGGIGIARQVSASPYERGVMDKVPQYNPKNQSAFQVDLRGADLRGLDLTSQLDDLLYSTFDSNTIWTDKLPQGFDPDAVIQNGMNPGLGVRSLHETGIDGSGVSIAIIDQPMLTGHEEFKNSLVHYEEIHILNGKGMDRASMHGGAVASIAVGENIGVAPKAKLYYIAVHSVNTRISMIPTYKHYARAIDRILVINEKLPAEEKIRVISISHGWDKGLNNGYKEIQQAIERAKQSGVFVISSSLQYDYGFSFAGLFRDPMGNPDDINSYSVGIFQRDNAEYFADRLFVPMDSRAYAAWTGENDYSYNTIGGWSWSIPYIAGLYVLGAQVYPEITPEVFWDCALESADSITVKNNGKDYNIKYLVNPVKIIEVLGKL